MRFAAVSAAVLAFAATAIAQTAGFDPITAPVKDEEVAAGSTYTVVWQPGTQAGKVSLTLLGGETPSTLVALGPIGSGVDNQAGKFQWAVDASLGDDATYGIQITLESNEETFQYSFPFKIAPSQNSGYPTKGESSSTYPTTVTVSSSASTTGYPTKATEETTTSTYVVTTTSSEVTYPTTTPAGNLSTTAVPTYGQTTLSSLTTVGPSGSKTTSSPSTIPTAGAARVAAGSLALLGGLAAALAL